MSLIVRSISTAISVLLAGSVVAACSADPTPIVEENAVLSFAPTFGKGPDGQVTASGEYRLGPNDRTRITVFGQPTLTGEYTLDGAGLVAFPLIGEVDAYGMTPRDLQKAIAIKLEAEYLRNPSVSVEVLTRRPFYILGEVQKPGNYPYVTHITALNAVAMAGGYTYRARTSQFYIKRLDSNGRMVRIAAKPETIIRPGDTLEVAERYF